MLPCPAVLYIPLAIGREMALKSSRDGIPALIRRHLGPPNLFPSIKQKITRWHPTRRNERHLLGAIRPLRQHIQETFHTPPHRGGQIISLKDELAVKWERGGDLNPGPPAYETSELPDCSTPLKWWRSCRACISTLRRPWFYVYTRLTAR